VAGKSWGCMGTRASQVPKDVTSAQPWTDSDVTPLVAPLRWSSPGLWSALGVPLHQLVGFMAEMGHLGVGLYLHQQALDTSTPAGKAMLNMCGVFAEFEREMIVERVNAGLRRARAQGKTLGRPKVGDDVEAAVRRLRGRGSGIKAIARELKIGVSVVQRVVHAGSPGLVRWHRMNL
jgi:hypothetical protein